MNFYWVNHNQTSEAEVNEGYLWSPKTKKNGHTNWSYELMKEVKPGDLVFSYSNTKISAIGYATSTAYTSTKPDGFSEGWNEDGWKVDVKFERLPKDFHPKSHIKDIEPLLTTKYSPINDKGNGNQACYLARITDCLAYYIFDKLDFTIGATYPASDSERVITERFATVAQRIGQDRFRKLLLDMYNSSCQLTGTNIKPILRASHIIPWSKSDSVSRLDPYNGLLLVSHVDALFDNGLISFENDGTVIFSKEDIREFFIDSNLPFKIDNLSPNSHSYLNYHRENVFKGSNNN